MKNKPKYYVVWVGKVPGVYNSWAEAQAQIAGFPAAKYKSFKSKSEAEAAFSQSWKKFYQHSGGQKSPNKPKVRPESGKLIPPDQRSFSTEIRTDSISVDAACSGNPGVMEYRGVKTKSGEEIFHSPVFPLGTNNIGEFLAIVHALALYHEKFPQLTIYTDSRTALSWIKKKKVRTNLVENEKTEDLWAYIRRAENWLRTHQYNNPLLKWETERWGEIPADFGRK